MRCVKWGWAAACLCFGATVDANDIKPLDLPDMGAPTFTTFSARDGVPDSVIVSVQTDRDGFVWLASSQGLARYDGHRWDSSAPLGAKGTLGTLLTDHEGTLWVAFRDNGIARFDGHAWQHEDAARLPSQRIRRIAETRDNAGRPTLWALTIDRSLLLHDGDRWIPAPGADALPRSVIAIAHTASIGGTERLWIGTANNGLWYREHDQWQRFEAPQFDATQIEGLLTTQTSAGEQLWIATFGAGLWRIDADGMRAWTVEDGSVSTDAFYSLVQTRDADGTLVVWAASRDGLVRVHGDHAQVFDRRYGLPSNSVRNVDVWRSPDGVDVLWLATENGVARTIVNGNPWQTVSLLGASSSGVFNLLIEPDDHGGQRLWVASSFDGLGLFDDGRWSVLQPDKAELRHTDMRLIRRVDGTLWVGFSNGALATLDSNGHFHEVDVPWRRSLADAVSDMLVRTVDGHEEHWIATRTDGQFRWRDGRWTAFPSDAPRSRRITRLVEQIDANGKSWIWGTGIGYITRFDGERIATLGKDIGLGDGIYIGATLLPDDHGRTILWLGSDHGIVRVDVTDPMHPTRVPNDLPPAPDSTVYDALRDANGRLYLCTNDGVQMLTPQLGGYTSRVFTRRDGMVHDECNTNARLIDARGRYWTGTLGGVTVFDPSLERRDRQPKPLKLTAVRVDGHSVPQDAVRVPSGDHDVRADFGLLSWQDEDESTFRTRLVGYENESTPWTSQNFRAFTTLPPGRFTLHVEARDYAGNASQPIDLPIDVLPEWWQTTWAKLLLTVAGLLIAYAVFAWRTSAMRAQQRSLERVVGARTAELNEANSRLVELSYKDALTGLANRRRLLDVLGTFAPNDVLSLIFVDVDHFKSYNDRFGHPAGDETLRRVAATLLDHAPVDALVARYGGEEFACVVPRTDIHTTRLLAEKFRTAVEQLVVNVPGTGQVNRVTISAGVACHTMTSEADTHKLMRDADIALYQAKAAGRNCVRG
ncbi:MAG TPA: diguanylate cyclase [Rudaea sp.]|jgi:diguanylate cyclase (GGDEF)-like protein|nr:diguanylate cyclase [Rudaea sp.]